MIVDVIVMKRGGGIQAMGVRGMPVAVVVEVYVDLLILIPILIGGLAFALVRTIGVEDALVLIEAVAVASVHVAAIIVAAAVVVVVVPGLVSRQTGGAESTVTAIGPVMSRMVPPVLSQAVSQPPRMKKPRCRAGGV